MSGDSVSGLQARRDGAFFIETEALARAAAERLSAGDAMGAFALADRRCRTIVPSARDLFLRAQTQKAVGRLAAAQKDLAAAITLDPTDAAIDRAALAWGDEATRFAAAERIVARADAPETLRRQALAALFQFGRRSAHGLRRSADNVSGWIAWREGESLRIEIGDADGVLVEPDPEHPVAGAGIAAAEVAIEVARSGPSTLKLRVGDESFEIAPEPQFSRTRAAEQPAPAVPPRSDPTPFVNIVVPVYEDFEATRACLDALAAARPAFAHRILVVDDASPNEALKRHLDAAAARGEFELIRNEINAGFAAAVNRALKLRARGDALILNADVVLPPRAIDRLAALCRSSPDIGAATPFSNNGELTSYPVRNEANPLPSAAEIAELDARAAAANGDALVDIPNGVGFCLYVTQACLDAVGALPEVYGRGYYEDVEFCLTARECGFRNVAAPGVYVGHAGSKSFGAHKRALVMRNLQLLEARFPGYSLETAAFVALDPLRPYRAAFDAACPPEDEVEIVACGPGAAHAMAEERAAQRKSARPDRVVLILRASPRGEAIALAAVDGGAPQTLSFAFAAGEAARFAAYLARLDVRAVELIDPASLPDAALGALLALAAPIDLVCGALSWFSPPPSPHGGDCLAPGDDAPCAICRAAAAQDDGGLREKRRLKLGRALERAERVTPTDGVADAFAQRVFKARATRLAPAPAATAGAGRIARLGVLYPHRAPAIDKLLLALARRLAGAETVLVVFGATLDDSALMATGRAFVAGPVARADYAQAARDHGVDGWLGPNRGGGYGELEAAAAAIGAAKAYFDWSFGAFALEWGDLSLDPRICDDKAAAQIVGWLERRS